MAEYTSESNPTPATGIVGTVLGGTALAGVAGLLGGSGLGGLFGGNSSTQQQLSALQMENSILKANAETDTKLVDVYTELRKQDKAQDTTISALSSRVLALETAAPLREQIMLGQVNSVAQSLASSNAALQASIAGIQATLAGITKTVVPNTSVCPGWGSVTITPATSTTSTT